MATKATEIRIRDELKHLKNLGILKISNVSETAIFNQELYVTGPDKSPYSGLKFTVGVNFPADYPDNPPVVTMKTRIFHPNIAAETPDRKGKIGMKMLGANWSKSFTVSDVFRRIAGLLRNPDVDTEGIVVDEEAAKMYRKDRGKYEESARKKAQPYSGYFTL